jgi:RNA polymerase primary sigma factor
MAAAFSDYLSSIGRIPLLTAQEEIILGGQVRRWLDWKGEPPASVVRIGRRARTRMMEANLRLVVSLAKKYSYRAEDYGMDMVDVIQEGSLGLARAVEKFDPARGYKFSTYSYWWIRQAITKALSTSTSIKQAIRLPLNAREEYNKIMRLMSTYEAEHGVTPSMEYLAQATNKTPAGVRNLIAMVSATRTCSLDAVLLDDGGTLLDTIADPQSLVETDLDQELAVQALALLPDDIRETLERSVMNDESLKAIGRDQGMTGEAVRQRRTKGLENLRLMMCAPAIAA